jgi:hypothetical protein
LKVAIVKQALDVFGPWASFKWECHTPSSIAELWPGKATYWELTCALRADWYIIDQRVTLDYTRDAVHRHPGRVALLNRHVTGVVALGDIPFDDYDLVITMDPFLPDVSSDACMAYFCQEHWDPAYVASLLAPAGRYDLFLDHMMSSDTDVKALPAAISCPYLRLPETVRATCSRGRDDAVWIDWRTLTTLAMTETWTPAAENTVLRLESVLGARVRGGWQMMTQAYGISDPPAWGNLLRYYEGLSTCQFYVGVGRDAGPGQGAADAASAGCIVVGESGRPYHDLICHPECLCESLADLPACFRRLHTSTDLQHEALSWQESALHDHVMSRPLGELSNAIELKAQTRSAGIANRGTGFTAEVITSHTRRRATPASQGKVP